MVYGNQTIPRLLIRGGRAFERAIDAEVRAGEWRLVWVFFANLFLLLTAYYLLKVNLRAIDLGLRDQ